MEFSTQFLIGVIIAAFVSIIALGTAIYYAKKKHYEELRFARIGANLSESADILTNINKSITFDEDIKSLLDKKELTRAEQLAKSRYQSDTSNQYLLEQYLAVLLSFNDKGKADEAWSVLRNVKGNPVLHSNLCYTFWEHGDIRNAIEVAEAGLRVSQELKNRIVQERLKNNLAYFYAEVGDSKYEELARTYATETYKEDSASRLDTTGYVKIVFGRNVDEITEGINLCLKAFVGNKQIAHLCKKHINRGVKRIEEIAIGSHQSNAT